MKSALNKLINRLRYGRPVIVVSGLPRSGTSMMMQMLKAGGLEILSDEIRTPDEDNPRGYFEYELVKGLGKEADQSWLTTARGKVIKVISLFLKHLPGHLRYKIVFMDRDLDEILASQNKMLKNRNQQESPGNDQLRTSYEKHLKEVMFFVKYRKNFEMLVVRYAEAIKHPMQEAQRIQAFLGADLNVSAMAGAVEKTLYRNRRET